MIQFVESRGRGIEICKNITNVIYVLYFIVESLHSGELDYPFDL